MDDSRVKLKRVIWHLDLRALVHETLGFEFDIGEVHEIHCNGEILDYEVDSDQELVARAFGELARHGAQGLSLEEILAMLHHHGKLEAGELCIHVWW